MSVFRKFHEATYRIELKFPTTVNKIVYFISWLYKQGKSFSTISTYLSGLSYYHPLTGLVDPTQFFVIKNLLKGAQNLATKPDIRLPITPQILLQLVRALKHTVS
jgi:hypothetical protein